ncbi:MAG: tRNA uridine-5-carboxymethylaminomethyl(34) synthesis GTPase MnmE [Rhodospirillales bacterium]|nr:tRNA uridine-5-carboxymethylaminomethyl(34) synthesis GTPase MnmE [Rhodospirillales bacterium]MDH3913799.1 tRNA uridine-5-carboxymethylaminomethyl(34) synthesis GTPase MnmE [Rhodospirillales bacterium]MDH3917142.1 tRNA uridine-5-carboxymethylaminomethyl(34) synthesis GTPase MnmE [Rhodospirillales bacterium]MDH3966486.1 tRNA uridine-5-carboxymethylaminomethyl(34) synthesis GTPase MnmE [Rhodospirillales bacterium]
MDSPGDTIFALSTPPGRAGIGVVRLSGPAAGAALEALAGAPRPTPRVARLRQLIDPDSRAPLDRALVLWIAGPASFTGEDMAELHLHGGRAVPAAVIGALSRRPGLRPAEPGEFTRRAFDNGKLDLSEVEGLADLIDAETDAQRRQALRQMTGGLSRLTEDWRTRLLSGLAHLEAAIDFPEEDLPEAILDRARAVAAELVGEIGRHLADQGRGERLRDGLQIAIVGPPNSGKSSLLNALARRDVAIVSEVAGTTRDVIEVHLDLGGYPVTLADTAGLRTLDGGGGDAVEQEGMRRARGRAAEADLKLAVFDVTTWPDLDPEAVCVVDQETLLVLNKIDARPGPPDELGPLALRDRRRFAISARTGQGLDRLLEEVERRVVERLGVAGASPAVTRARHRRVLEDCRASLERVATAELPELAAEDLRLSTRALGRITGRVDVEDVLDVVFGDFCIGK